MGETLGAVILAGNDTFLKTTYAERNLRVVATGAVGEDGQITIDQSSGSSVKVLEHVDPSAYYHSFADRLGNDKDSAVVGSFEEQRRIWSFPQK